MRAQKDDDGDEKSFQNYSLKYMLFQNSSNQLETPPKKAKTFFEKAKTEKNDDGDFQNHSLKYFFFKSVKTLHTLITETDMESG